MAAAETFETIADGVDGRELRATSPASGSVTYGYRVRERTRPASAPPRPPPASRPSTTGSCTAPPDLPRPRERDQSPARLSCRGGSRLAGGEPALRRSGDLHVYRGVRRQLRAGRRQPDRPGGPGTRLCGYGGARPGFPSFYVVRAVDAGNGNEEANLVRRRATATGPVAGRHLHLRRRVGDPPLDTLTGRPGSCGPSRSLRSMPAGTRWRPASTPARAASVRATPTTSASRSRCRRRT